MLNMDAGLKDIDWFHWTICSAVALAVATVSHISDVEVATVSVSEDSAGDAWRIAMFRACNSSNKASMPA